MSRRLKAADVYRAVNYTRNQLRGLLAELDYRFETTDIAQPRVARTYSPHDFLMLLIACDLDTMGLKRSAIALLLPAIAQELSGPRPVARHPKLVLTLNPPMARYVDGEVTIEEGIVRPLSSIFARADFQIVQTGRDLPYSQGSLNFAPALITEGANPQVVGSKVRGGR